MHGLSTDLGERTVNEWGPLRFRNPHFRLNYPIGCEHLHVTYRVTAGIAIHGCAVGMGDASRGRYTGRLWETSSDLGETIAHVTLLIYVCILFHLLVSLMHQVYIKTFCMRHQLLPEFSFHQPPENFQNIQFYLWQLKYVRMFLYWTSCSVGSFFWGMFGEI